MVQTLTLQDGPGFVVEDRLLDFANSLDITYYSSPDFIWDYDVQEAIDFSSSYDYDNYELVRLINDSVEHLRSTRNYVHDYGYDYGYYDDVIDSVYINGSGAIRATINEDVISDLVSDDLIYADYNFSSDRFLYDLGYSDATESAVINDGVVYDPEYLASILSQANDITGLNYLEANPDLDTVISSASLDFNASFSGMDATGSANISLSFLPDILEWDVSGTSSIDAYMYGGMGGYFEDYSFKDDLEMEIDSRFDPYIHGNYYSYSYPDYSSIDGHIDLYEYIEYQIMGLDPEVNDFFNAYGYESAINMIMSDEPDFYSEFGFDPMMYPEIDRLVELYREVGMSMYPPVIDYGYAYGYVDSYTIAENIASQLYSNNYAFMDGGYGYINDYTGDFEMAMQDIAYSLNTFSETDGSNVFIENPATSPYFVEGISDPIIPSELNPIFPVEAKFDSEAINLSYQFVDEDGDVIENIMVLGDDSSTTYTLQILADTLIDGFALDSADIEFGFNSKLFDNLDSSSIKISEDYETQSSFLIDNNSGVVRFAGANLTDLETGGTSFNSKISISDYGYNRVALNQNDFLSQIAKELGVSLDSKTSLEWSHEVRDNWSINVDGEDFDFAAGIQSDDDKLNSGGGSWMYLSTAPEFTPNNDISGSYDVTFNRKDSAERISSNVLASIDLDFNEDGLSSLAKNDDGSFVDSSLGFSLSANLNDTVLSRDIDGGLNKEIYNVAQFGGDKFTLEGSTDVYLYEQKAGIIETGDGLILSTDRIIGADAAVTNLVRSGDTVSATTSWLNIGNVELDILNVKGGGGNVELVNYELSKNTLDGGIFEGGSFTSSSDTADLTADFAVVGQAGQVVDLNNVLDVETSVGDDIFTNSSGTKNLITYQGDLNYDGRVSMKDLAYLNAGAARVNSGGDVAGDVDANFDDSIDILDLAVLDKDWGKSLHQGDEGFLGSSEITWEDLDKQGEISWDNSVFKEQNAFEAFDGFVGSLESPTSNVIGADGNTVVNDDDMLGNTYQDLG